jgi:HAD superfamily hydrolase (TIGR01549 family)
MNPESSIKGILFDVDGTLYHQGPVRIATLLVLACKYVLRPITMWRSLRIIRAYRSALEELRRGNGSINPVQAQRERTAMATGLPVNLVRDVIDEWMMKRPLRFLRFFSRRGMIEFIHQARRQGFVLGAFSDYPCEEKLKFLGIYEYFSTVASSYDEDILRFKPDPAGLLFCCRKLGLQPSEVVYLGDRVEVDGDSASQCGMQFVLLSGSRASGAKRTDLVRVKSFGELATRLLEQESLAGQRGHEND